MALKMSSAVTTVLESEEEVVKELSQLIASKAKAALDKAEVFKIGLSGGSLAKFLCAGLPQIETDWSRWCLFFCDERLVPFSSSDSTYSAYKEGLVGKVPLTEEQFIKVDPNLSADVAAMDYIQKMSLYFPPDCLPQFDMLLLGMGPDGHTCSLFPGHKLLEETLVWVSPITDSPKPPPCRITLTFPVINNAKCCVFTATGTGKADMVKRILKDREDLPATRVQPVNGELIWLLDKGAASLLAQ